jgi:hypothetical protein
MMTSHERDMIDLLAIHLNDVLVNLPHLLGEMRDDYDDPCSRNIPLIMIRCFLSILMSSFELNHPVWSCSWNPRCPYEIYGGLADGTIVILDLRYPSSRPLYKLEGLLEKKLPIHSLTCLSPPLPPSSSAQDHPQQQQHHHHDSPEISLSDEPDSNYRQSEHTTGSSYLFGATLAYPFRLDLACLSQSSEFLTTTAVIEPLNRPLDEDYYCTSLHVDTETAYYMSSFRFQPKIDPSTRTPRPTLHSIGRIHHDPTMTTTQSVATANNAITTIVSTFEGPSNQVLLSRALLFSASSSLAEFSARRLLAAISDETHGSLSLYEIDTQKIAENGTSPRLFQNLPTTTTLVGRHENSSIVKGGILDSCHIAHPYYGDFLAVLTNTSRVLLHRLQSV